MLNGCASACIDASWHDCGARRGIKAIPPFTETQSKPRPTHARARIAAHGSLRILGNDAARAEFVADVHERLHRAVDVLELVIGRDLAADARLALWHHWVAETYISTEHSASNGSEICNQNEEIMTNRLKQRETCYTSGHAKR